MLLESDHPQDFLDITLLTDDELIEAFNKCDKDHSGTIEKSEVCVQALDQIPHNVSNVVRAVSRASSNCLPRSSPTIRS